MVVDNFTTKAFEIGSRLYLSHLSLEKDPAFNYRKATRSPVYRGPRVGLTLNRFDEYKCRFWMADYRFVVYPEKHRKQQALVILGMLGNTHALSPSEVVAICKCKKPTVEQLHENLENGKNSGKKIEDFR